jgi:exodeoxyribonuclease III
MSPFTLTGYVYTDFTKSFNLNKKAIGVRPPYWPSFYRIPVCCKLAVKGQDDVIFLSNPTPRGVPGSFPWTDVEFDPERRLYRNLHTNEAKSLEDLTLELDESRIRSNRHEPDPIAEFISYVDRIISAEIPKTDRDEIRRQIAERESPGSGDLFTATLVRLISDKFRHPREVSSDVDVDHWKSIYTLVGECLLDHKARRDASSTKQLELLLGSLALFLLPREKGEVAEGIAQAILQFCSLPDISPRRLSNCVKELCSAAIKQPLLTDFFLHTLQRCRDSVSPSVLNAAVSGIRQLLHAAPPSVLFTEKSLDFIVHILAKPQKSHGTKWSKMACNLLPLITLKSDAITSYVLTYLASQISRSGLTTLEAWSEGLKRAVSDCIKLGKRLVWRLDGTSDIPTTWRQISNIVYSPPEGMDHSPLERNYASWITTTQTTPVGDSTRFVSFNIDGLLKAWSSGQLQKLIKKVNPDIMHLSETKCSLYDIISKTGTSMKDFLQARGYSAYFTWCDNPGGQRHKWGSALITKIPPLAVQFGFGHAYEVLNNEGRFILARFQDYTLVGSYAPCTAWDESVVESRRVEFEHARLQVCKGLPNLICLGDNNCALRADDSTLPRNPSLTPGTKSWERANMETFLSECGLTDVYMHLNAPTTPAITWARSPIAFARGEGMRIDHVLATREFLQGERRKFTFTRCELAKLPFGSDHRAIIAVLTKEKTTSDDAHPAHTTPDDTRGDGTSDVSQTSRDHKNQTHAVSKDTHDFENQTRAVPAKSDTISSDVDGTHGSRLVSKTPDDNVNQTHAVSRNDCDSGRQAHTVSGKPETTSSDVNGASRKSPVDDSICDLNKSTVESGGISKAKPTVAKGDRVSLRSEEGYFRANSLSSGLSEDFFEPWLGSMFTHVRQGPTISTTDTDIPDLIDSSSDEEDIVSDEDSGEDDMSDSDEEDSQTLAESMGNTSVKEIPPVKETPPTPDATSSSNKDDPSIPVCASQVEESIEEENDTNDAPHPTNFKIETCMPIALLDVGQSLEGKPKALRRSVLIDTGCLPNCISYTLFKELGLKLIAQRRDTLPIFEMLNGKRDRPLGRCKVPLWISENTVINILAYVVQGQRYDIVMGSSELKARGANIDYTEGRATLSVGGVQSTVSFQMESMNTRPMPLYAAATTVIQPGQHIIDLTAPERSQPWTRFNAAGAYKNPEHSETSEDFGSTCWGLITGVYQKGLMIQSTMLRWRGGTKTHTRIFNYTSEPITVHKLTPLAVFAPGDEEFYHIIEDATGLSEPLKQTEPVPTAAVTPQPSSSNMNENGSTPHSNVEANRYCPDGTEKREERPTDSNGADEDQQTNAPDAIDDKMRLDKIEIGKGSNLTEDERGQVRNLCEKFIDIFREPTHNNRCLDKGITAELRLNKTPQFTAQTRILNPSQREALSKLIGDQRRKKIIVESKSATTSPVILVPKPGGKWRFCVDYTQLNKITESDAYSIPQIDSYFTTLGGNTHFSTFDLVDAFWSIPLHKNSQELTAFTCPDGLFHYQRMPQGIKQGPATFSRFIDRVFSGLKWEVCVTYIDDVVVYTKSYEAHMEALEKIFSRVREYGLFFKPEKCKILTQELKFLGHVISKEGIRLDEDKTKAVADMPKPKTRKQLRSTLGFFGYFRKYIKGFSRIVSPLQTQLRGGTKDDKVHSRGKVDWTDPAATRAWDYIIKALTTPPILTHPDWSEPFSVHVDACKHGLGAVLTQKRSDGLECIIMYASKSLTEIEQRYQTWELEAYACVWAVTNIFKQYLLPPYGKKFKLYTDNSAISKVFSLDKQNGLSSRVAHWKLRLSEYDYDIIHTPGKLHTVPDMLSRCPLESTCPYGEQLEPPLYQHHTHLLLTSTASLSLLPAEMEPNDFCLANQQAEDPDCITLRNLIGKGKEIPFVLDSTGLLYRTFRSQPDRRVIILPKTMRHSIIQQAHGITHRSKKHMIELIENLYHWPGMVRDVIRWCACCLNCRLPTQVTTAHFPPADLDAEPIEAFVEQQKKDKICRLPTQVTTAHFPPEDLDADSIEAFVEQQKKDKDCIELCNIATKDKDSPFQTNSENGALYHVVKKLDIDKIDRTLQRLVVPNSLKRSVIQRAHGLVHSGVKRTLRMISARYFWSNMVEDITRWCSCCLICRKRKTTRPWGDGIPKTMPCTRVLQRVAMDLMGKLSNSNDNYYILTMIDVYSRFVMTIPLPNKIPATIAKAIFNHLICVVGIPESILTDQGTEFINQGLKSMYRTFGIRKIDCSPNSNSKGNGHVERFHRFVNSSMYSLQISLGPKWSDYVHAVCFAYNMVANEATGFSPHYLMFGRHPNLPDDVCYGFNPNREHEHSIQDNYHIRASKIMNDVYNFVHKRQMTMTEKNRMARELGGEQPDYKPEQPVLLFQPGQPAYTIQDGNLEIVADSPKKWTPQWTGPHTILRKTGPNNYDVVHGKQGTVYKNQNVNAIFPWNPWSDTVSSTSENHDPLVPWTFGGLPREDSFIAIPLEASFEVGRLLEGPKDLDDTLHFHWWSNKDNNHDNPIYPGWYTPKENIGRKSKRKGKRAKLSTGFSDTEPYYKTERETPTDQPWTDVETETRTTSRDILLNGFALTKASKISKAVQWAAKFSRELFYERENQDSKPS